MGRAFEFRKERKFKRWNAMSRTFTKIGREIAMAVKTGGADPTTNSRLRLVIQNAKDASMPKDTIDAAIKRASNREEKDYQEVVYEGYGPHGVAMIIETATDNPTRTVASVRMYFSKGNGAMGTQGSVSFMFDRKCIFVLSKEGLDLEALELDLIDAGADDIHIEEDEVIVYAAFEDFGNMQKALEEKHIKIISSELQRIPSNYKQVTSAQEADINKLIDRFEEDDDVINVFHNMETTAE